MKRVFVLLISFFLAGYGHVNCSDQDQAKDVRKEGAIVLITTPELTLLAKKLADEYSSVNSSIAISLQELTAENMAAELSDNSGIAILSGHRFETAVKENTLRTVIGRDVIVPVINAKNSLMPEILSQGISAEALGRYLSDQAPGSWEALVNGQKDSPAHYYSLNDESLEGAIERFVSISSINKEGKRFDRAGDMLAAIQNDPSAIGFFRLADIVDNESQSLAAGIKLMPLDRNANGAIDFSEEIYGDLNSFTRGVWIGKYPKSLISNIYTLAEVGPENETAAAFLTWVVTAGQQFLPGSGYTDLLASERESAVVRISSAGIIATPALAGTSVFRSIFLVILALVALAVIAELLIRFYRGIKYADVPAVPVSQNVLRQESMVIPAGLYFDKTHTWAFMDQEGIVTTGVDDFLQHVTGSITRLKLKSPGKKIKKGEHFLSVIQNGKQLDLYSPLSGTIVETNSSLEKDTSVINTSPYKEGWIYKIEPSNWVRENPLLFMADKQKQFIKNEFTRLRDFLANSLKADTESYAQVVLQDGGEIRDGVLSSLGPEVWEDFQTRFIDPSRQVWFYEI